MTAPADIPGLNNSGLIALTMLLRFQGVGADPAQILHQCGAVVIGTAEMIRCAKSLGLKARAPVGGWCASKGSRPMLLIWIKVDPRTLVSLY